MTVEGTGLGNTNISELVELGKLKFVEAAPGEPPTRIPVTPDDECRNKSDTVKEAIGRAKPALVPVGDQRRNRSDTANEPIKRAIPVSPRGPPAPITVTVAETRRITGLGNTTVYELIKRGELTTVKVGRRRLVLYSSIEALLQPSKD
jgi:excisionase family DNA binding protein